MSEGAKIEKVERVTIHIKLRKDLYEKLWEEVKRRYVSPVKKFHVVLEEAVEQYLKSRQQQ